MIKAATVLSKKSFKQKVQVDEHVLKRMQTQQDVSLSNILYTEDFMELKPPAWKE